MSPTITRLARIAFGLAILVTLYFAFAPAADGGSGGPYLHALAFFTLGFLSQLSAPRHHFVTLLLILAAFGGAIELVQGTPLVHRDMQFGDFVVDFLAAMIGLAIGSASIHVLTGNRQNG